MVLDSLKGVVVLKSVRLMWQSTIFIDKNFLVFVRIASTRRFWRFPAVCVLGGDRRGKNIFTAVKISLFELVCFHEELFCVFYCVYNLYWTGDNKISYLW